MAADRLEVALRPWSADDLPLLERLMGDPAMTEHLGGPETPEKIRERQARYVAIVRTGRGRMFAITVGPDAQPAGSIGYWEKEWHGETIWETGWSVIPEFQGRGVATQALELVVPHAAAEGRHRSIHAFPSVDNAAPNAICRKGAFRLLGEVDFEYPPGSMLRCNDWVLELD